MAADDTLISVSVTTVEFAPAPSGTTLTFTEQGVFLDGGDRPAMREKGTGGPARCPGCVADLTEGRCFLEPRTRAERALFGIRP